MFRSSFPDHTENIKACEPTGITGFLDISQLLVSDVLIRFSYIYFWHTLCDLRHRIISCILLYSRDLIDKYMDKFYVGFRDLIYSILH